MPVTRKHVPSMSTPSTRATTTAPPESTAVAEEHRALVHVASELVRLEAGLVDLEREMQASIDRVPEEWRESATNLVHYVALRKHDLRELQLELTQLGLSSLGRAEASVRESVRQASRRTHEALALRGDKAAQQALAKQDATESSRGERLTWATAKERLRRHTREALGPRPVDREIYIMVTAPSAREASRDWLVKVLRAGMNVLRINCAHEGPAEWQRIVDALASARRTTGRECRLLMDLAGPKIRTGTVAGARHIATWKPSRDDVGRIVAPVRVVVRRAEASALDAPPVGATLVLDEASFAQVRAGDELRFLDARKKKRTLEVRDVREDEIVCHATTRAYVLGHVKVRVFRVGERVADLTLEVRGGEGASVDVRCGDKLELTGRDKLGHAPTRNMAGHVVKRGVISCTLPEALAQLEVGHRVLFDDGRIEGVVEVANRKRQSYTLLIVRTQTDMVKLRAEKGINLPETPTTIPALTQADLEDLTFVAKHADAVSLSFVRRPEDVSLLHEELDKLGRADLGVVLKIETRAGFESLPRLLLEGLRRPPLAVMIARGDLAVEVGFERLAELQEEILWLCEACHVPAIWATQVLDTLARTGVPSRAEVTDAAASVAAECVMLNKGPYVDEAVRVLSNILRRMETHHDKKRSLFRKLKVSTFGEA